MDDQTYWSINKIWTLEVDGVVYNVFKGKVLSPKPKDEKVEIIARLRQKSRDRQLSKRDHLTLILCN